MSVTKSWPSLAASPPPPAKGKACVRVKQTTPLHPSLGHHRSDGRLARPIKRPTQPTSASDLRLILASRSRPQEHSAIRHTPYAIRHTPYAIRNTQLPSQECCRTRSNTRYAIRNVQQPPHSPRQCTRYAMRNTQYAASATPTAGMLNTQIKRKIRSLLIRSVNRIAQLSKSSPQNPAVRAYGHPGAQGGSSVTLLPPCKL